jgi:hypothetical protein
MSRLRFPSNTRSPRLGLRLGLGLGLALGLVTGAAVTAGCGDDSCGPGGAPAAGLVATGDQVALTFGDLRGGLNNDCPAAGAPAGVISLTIHGTQAGTSGFVTLCIERPDLLATQSQALGLELASAQVRLVDLSGSANNCSFAIDRATPAAGTATSSGLCGNGADAAGFALVLDGSLALTRTCGTTVDSVAVTLRGRVAVSAN